jgi:rRNA maturation endonuclease Nob1
MPASVANSYPDNQCPACGHDIPEDATEGDECRSCGHEFDPMDDCLYI